MIYEINTLSEEQQNQMLIYLCERGQLLNQIEVFDNLWDELMLQPFQVNWLRLLRINIRRLRSAIILAGPLLPSQGKNWLQFLRDTASELGDIREYDVAINGCEKYEKIMELEEENSEPLASFIDIPIRKQLSGLKQLLQQKRDVQCQMWLEHAKAGWISDGLAELTEKLEQDDQPSEDNILLAKEFLKERLQEWGLKLCEKLEQTSVASPMVDIHRLRIKIKRYRYSYDVYMRYNPDIELLEKLKAMQDMLGYIRDRERNISVMEKLVAAKAEEELTQEFQCYKAWSEKEISKKLESFDALRVELLEHIKNKLYKN